jgi:chemotaxis protein MotB
MRKKKHPEHVNHERWLISYADFITLLFAFFVVMFAVSQVDSNKMGRFTESFSKAVGIDVFPESGRGLLPSSTEGLLGPPRSTEKSQGAEIGRLQTALQRARASAPELQVVELHGEIVLRLPVSFAFESGDCALKPTARPLLEKIAEVVRERPVDVRVEGHTDNRPIQTPRFHSNWELSTCRATAVVLELARDRMDATRLSASGYGEFHPLASNDTPAGRAQNRRVDIVLKLQPASGTTPSDAAAVQKGAPEDAGVVGQKEGT